MKGWSKRGDLINLNGQRRPCLTKRQIVGYALQELSDDEQQQVEKHMQECKRCKQVVNFYRFLAQDEEFSLENEELLEDLDFDLVLDVLESLGDRPLGVSQEMLKIIERRARWARSTKALDRLRAWAMKLIDAWHLATWAAHWRQIVTAAVALVVIPTLVVTLLVSFLIRPSESNLEQQMVALRRVYLKQRKVEPRLSGGFPHARYQQPPSEETTAPDRFLYAPYEARRALGPPDEANAIGSLVSELLAMNTDQRLAQQVAGRVYILSQKPEHAERTLTGLLQDDPNNPQLHNDLGVALFEKGDLPKALWHFDKAVQLDGKFAEALFNRALCHQRLYLLRAARDDWDRYLKLEPDPDWSGEADRHQEEVEALLKFDADARRKARLAVEDDFRRAYAQRNGDMARQLVDDHPHWIRLLAEAKTIPEYLESRAQGNQQVAQEKLRLAEYIGELLTIAKGDLAIANAVRAYRAMPRRTWGPHWAAFQERQPGITLMQKGDYEASNRALRNAARALARWGDPLYPVLAELQVAENLYMQQEYLECIELFNRLLPQLRELGDRRYEFLVLNDLGGAYNFLGNHAESLKYLRQALEFEEKNKVWIDMGTTFNFIGINQNYLGQYRLAIEAFEHALEVSLTITRPVVVEALYQNLGYSYMKLKDYWMAAKYQDEVLFRKEQAKDPDPYYLSSTLTNTAQVYIHLEDYEKARHYLNRAQEVNRTIKDPKQRQDAELFRLIRLGRLHRSLGEMEEAIKVLDQCRSLIGQKQQFRLDLYSDIARTRLALGQYPQAREDLDQAIKVFEENRAMITRERERNLFFTRGRDLYDNMVLLLYDRLGDKEAAFDYSERSKARTFLDLVSTDARLVTDREKAEMQLFRDAQPHRYAEIVAALPEDVTLLNYAVTPEKVIIWVINRGQPLRTAASPVKPEDLQRQVEQFVASIKKRAPIFQVLDQAGQLYRLLIEPIAPFLDWEKTLCIIPDGCLHYLPFAALRSPTNRYMVTDYILATSPSASIFLHCLKLTQGKPASPSKLLAIGNPKVAEEFQSSDLPHAEQEVAQIARYYPGAVKLLGSEATEERVVQAMPRAQVIHFAAHVRIREREPMYSAVGLAPGRPARSRMSLSKLLGENRQDGLLQMFELYGLKLPQTSLVVLSGCESGLGGFAEGEGLVGLTRPFIRAGVPTLVVSLWPIKDSPATVELMLTFHRWRRAGGARTAAALREAQLQLVGSPSHSHPYYWAPFLVVGSYR